MSRSPPMSAHATSDFCSVTARSECGTKSTCALAKSAGVSVVCGGGREGGGRQAGERGRVRKWGVKGRAAAHLRVFGKRRVRLGCADGGTVDGACHQVFEVGDGIAFRLRGERGIIKGSIWILRYVRGVHMQLH